MFNLVVLSGRITANPELKTTANGVPVCTFSIAVERRYKQGEEKQTDFINIVAWRGTAEVVAKHFTKGNMIGIEGSIQTRKYQDNNGNNRTLFEVIANNVQFVESKKANENNSTPTSQSFSNANATDFVDIDVDEDCPF
jgi:single-strand DNA-binding protein